MSDTKGGQQAVGVGRGAGNGGGGGGGINEAVDFFFRSQGMHRLYSEVEVRRFENPRSLFPDI